MKYNSTILLGALALASIFQACAGTGETILDNPFGEGGTADVKAGYTSNADTVFLTWSLNGDIAFDSYLIQDQAGKNSITLPKEATECELTHIPYNQRVTISISLMSGNTVLSRTDVPVQIDGLDSYIASVIIPDKGSVVEGDGMYSIDLGDGKSIFLMGDSYIGEVSGQQRVSGDHMYRNTYSIFDYNDMSSRALANEKGTNTSAAVPDGVTNEGERWYWPGHGFVVGDNLYIMQQLMFTGDGPSGWNFYYDETHILQYSVDNILGISDQKSPVPSRTGAIPYQDEPPLTPSYEEPLVHFGAAALNDLDGTGYLYIYAQTDLENSLKPVTEVYVARALESNLYTSWEYYNGSTWSPDQNTASAMAGLETVAVSSQFNVFKLEGKYVLIAQDKSWNSGLIYTFISDNPYGPWGHKTLIYQIPPLTNENWYTYNAMAHPQIEKDGMILVSYNVNTQEFSEQQSNVYSYRPRFFWVEKDTILNR